KLADLPALGKAPQTAMAVPGTAGEEFAVGREGDLPDKLGESHFVKQLSGRDIPDANGLIIRRRQKRTVMGENQVSESAIVFREHSEFPARTRVIQPDAAVAKGHGQRSPVG